MHHVESDFKRLRNSILEFVSHNIILEFVSYPCGLSEQVAAILLGDHKIINKDHKNHFQVPRS